MPKDNEIALTIAGNPRRAGTIRVADLLGIIGALVRAARRLDIITTDASSIEFNVARLSLSSPASIVVEAIPLENRSARPGALLEALFEMLRRIRDAEPNETDMDTILLDELRHLVSPVGRGLAWAKLGYLDNTLEIDSTFARGLDMALAPESTHKGFIRGMLEAINIHKSANTFRLYPDVGPSKLNCHFPNELLHRAIEGVGHYIEAKGMLTYRPRAKYPHEIDVEEIEIFPPEDQLPSLRDIKGMAPDATGALSSEQFVRKLRDAKS